MRKDPAAPHRSQARGGSLHRGRIDRSPERVLWEEKRREDELRALDIRVVRIAAADLAERWPAFDARLRHLLATAGPAVRRFTATPRAHGIRRTG
jgi:hypothetical protein